MFFRKKKVEERVDSLKDGEAYDQTFKVAKIKVLVTIVARGTGAHYMKDYQDLGAPMSFLCFGKGTVEKELYEILGITDSRKDIVFTIANENLIPTLLDSVRKRFKAAKKPNLKGIAFAFELNSVAGVLAYKYLSNTKVNERKPQIKKEGEENGERNSNDTNELPTRRKTL